MALDKGTLILANYTAKVKDTNEALETTIEEEAKKLGIHDPTAKYEPRLIAVGEGWVLEGLDEALLNAEVGKKMKVEIPPEKAFGLRDPSKVRLIPLRKLGDKASQVSIGDVIEVDNRVGIVRYVGSGRVQVDFNHKLAGKTIVYEIEVVKRLETDDEKVRALIKRRLPIPEDKLTYELDNEKLKIEIPSDLFLLDGLQILKKALSSDIFKFIKKVYKVQFVETYESEEKREEIERKEEVKEEKPKEIVKEVKEEKVTKPRRRRRRVKES
jgi:peptidylprolyl isomerase